MDSVTETQSLLVLVVLNGIDESNVSDDPAHLRSKQKIPTATMNQPRQIKRSELKPGEVLCNYCTAKCCRYFSLSIDTPNTAADFDYLRWYLLHDFASVFTEGDNWYILVHTKCKHLKADNRCGIYETRPKICRDYTTKNCEYDDDYTYDRYFETGEQVAEYSNARFNNPETFRTPKPGLTILN